MVYSGMGPDYRVLVKRARKAAHEYKLYYGFEIPTDQLVSPELGDFTECNVFQLLNILYAFIFVETVLFIKQSTN
jgi:hypothetical protein